MLALAVVARLVRRANYTALAGASADVVARFLPEADDKPNRTELVTRSKLPLSRYVEPAKGDRHSWCQTNSRLRQATMVDTVSTTHPRKRWDTRAVVQT